MAISLLEESPTLNKPWIPVANIINSTNKEGRIRTPRRGVMGAGATLTKFGTIEVS
ncbi:MAG: hypothetical protein V7L04_02085 [Nostoc sp.]|uniref:hypothetical protein n=1 Tax=Nostoc sp. TaxID=1180 RepID=UPI002FF92848